LAASEHRETAMRRSAFVEEQVVGALKEHVAGRSSA
jgi:hypothetical protein